MKFSRRRKATQKGGSANSERRAGFSPAVKIFLLHFGIASCGQTLCDLSACEEDLTE
jgi:hypothetical protein